MPVALVCSECGSSRLSAFEQRGVDDWPMAVCHNHAKPRLVVLMSERAWQHKKKSRHTDAAPIDLFATLPLDEQAALRKPIR